MSRLIEMQHWEKHSGSGKLSPFSAMKNANSCPVDRIKFKYICVRTHFGGTVLKKLPVQNPNKDNEEEQEDVTNCEVCGRSDREDSLLLCDGCDAGYHLDCLTPALHTVPVEEWFCPECAVNNPTAVVEEIDDEEVAFLVADAAQEPTTSRLRPTARRTRAIARTRQSERVRANVNRNRITRAHQIRDVPQYLMNASLLDETIESVVAGLNTAVYHRPLIPRSQSTKKRRKRKGKKRKRAGTQKPRGKTSLSSGTTTRKHRRKTRRRKGAKKVIKASITTRSRIAKSLGLGRPVNGILVPSVYKPLEPSLKVMRTDIGAASLSVYGDPNDLDPFESAYEPVCEDTTNLGSPFSNKRRILSHSALRSHRPVARPISVKISSNGRLPAVGSEAQPEATHVPDVLESILAEQNVLLMDSSNIVINRDGSLKTKAASGQPPLLPSDRSKTGETTSGCSSSSASNSGNFTNAPKGGWKFAGFTAPVKSTSAAFPTSDLPSTPRKQSVSSNLRPAFSGTFTPMPEVSVGCGPGESISFPGTQRAGAPGKSAGDSQKGPSGFTPFRWLNSASNLHIKNNVGTLNRAPPKLSPRLDISELPRIPKIKNQTGSNMQGDGMPRISRLVGNDNNTLAAEFEKSSKSPFQERLQSSLASGSANSSSIFQGKLQAPGTTPRSSSQSWRKVVGGTDHPARLPKLDAYDPFEPTDDEIQHCGKQDSHSHLQPNVKNTDDIYDPFEPTGSDPSSSNSTPARNESRSEGERESPASSPGNTISGGDKNAAEALSVYFDSDAAQLSYTRQTESCRIEPRETENPASNLDTHESLAAPSLDSDLEPTCDSGDKTEPRVMTLSAEFSVDNEHTRQMFCSFLVSEDGPRSEQQPVNVDSASVLSSTCSDEGTLKAVDKMVPTSMRNDVDISPENELRSRIDKKVHTDSKVRSRSRSSSRSRRRSKNMVHEKHGGYRSRSRSKEWKRLRSHSRDQWRSKSRSRSRSSSSERYRRRKVKQERFREKRGRHSRSRSRERRSGSSSSEASTDSHKRRRRVSGSWDHKGSYKHSWSSTEKGKRRQYRRDPSREQYERRSRRSTSWSRERRHSRSSSRSRDKKKPWPKFREKARSWSRSSSRERRSRSRSSSRDKRRSRTRSSSREKRRSSRYKEKRRSRTRSRSKERRKPRTRSRTRSRSRDQSRSRSRDRGLQSKWQAIEVERRRNYTQEKVVSGEKDSEQKKMSPSTKLESTEEDASMPELTSSRHAESSQHAHDVPVDQSSSHSVDLKEESMVPNEAVQEEAKQIELPEQSKESSSQCENSGANNMDRFPAVDHGTLTSQAEAEIKGHSAPSEYFLVRSPSQVHAVAEEVSIPLLCLCKEEEIAPMAENEEALPLEDQPLPQPFPAKTEPPLAGADALESVKPAISADDQKEAVDMSTTEKPQSPVPSGMEAETCKSEQVENGAPRVCFQKEEPKQETVCLASSSITKQEESEIDGNKSSEKNLGSVKTESSKECGEIPLLQLPEPVKIKTEPEAGAQSTGVKAKPLVKRVTWNLDSEKDEVPSGRPARSSLSYRTHRYNKESSWKPPETSQPPNQVPMFQLPAPNYMIPPPIFPTLFPPQAFNQLNMPPPFMPPFPPLHPPPYAPVSQPAPPYVVQGNIPLIGSTPVPPLLSQPTYQAGTGASSLAAETHGPQVEGNLDTDNKASEDRTQSENYIKKLHVQERAVEEAKLALKPYYQNKEITKEEYKEILRKAVQKICHSKSGEINPVKVANLVKGYVEKYKHIRKYKKGAEGESSKESDTKAEEI
ncbi:PHD and RING finger domain-containing protein 1 isoform X3 [Narcine bancroftii]|uniref:PHD and RING finger domain-containing protein 1 isoform X3 n=1 Tax=Narcine bancroftii TaxID=1343680 RepID=UPI003831C2B3